MPCHHQEGDDKEAAEKRDRTEDHLSKTLVRPSGGSRYGISRNFCLRV
jgi:hypothetical protein